MAVKGVKGWKCLNIDMSCIGHKFEVGKTYSVDGEIELCENGFHFHRNENDIFKYYSFDKEKTVVCEVEAIGDVIDGDDKSVTSEIVIVRKLEWDEVLSLVNKNGNAGLHNSGHRNSGHRNSGDCNSGHRNSGHRNSGDCNSGCYNSGDYNSGDYNSGDYNSGHRNSGHRNSGDYNSGDCNSGFFNTNEPTVRMFNKDTGLMRYDIKLPNWLRDLKTVEFVRWSVMTDEEKKEINCFASGGYSKSISYKEAWKKLWSSLSTEQKKEIEELPNFDADIFYEITGIVIR